MRDDSREKIVVHLQGVRVSAEFPYDSALQADEFQLKGGELAVVEIPHELHFVPLADVVSGICIADEGRAMFRGANWRETRPDDAARARGEIGRVFDGIASNWVSNLDIDENLTLALRFHRGPLTEESRAQIEELSKIAGCWPAPEGRPASVAKNILRRLEWVRAFLGDPALVILERPLRDILGDANSPLGQLVERARGYGAAILLVVREDDSWQGISPDRSSRWRLRDGRLESVEKN